MKNSSKELKSQVKEAVKDLGATIHSFRVGDFRGRNVYTVWFSFDGNIDSSEGYEKRGGNSAQCIEAIVEYVSKRKNILYNESK